MKVYYKNYIQEIRAKEIEEEQKIIDKMLDVKIEK